MHKISRQAIHMMKAVFLGACGNQRVILGFLLGMALCGHWEKLFLQYAWDVGEPVNILEPLVVITHHAKNMLFLTLGYLLAISDAPFIKGNTYLVLCRGSRRGWGLGMLLYVMLLAFCYVTCMAAVAVVASSPWGFYGNIWSSPVYNLAMDQTGSFGVEYQIAFPWANIMQAMGVPQAFAVTFLFLWLYLVVLGMLLFVCNLLLKETCGILLVFGIQIAGYLLQQEGYYSISLLAKSMPGYSIDGAGGHWAAAAALAGICLLLAAASFWAAGRVDFKAAAEEA